MLDETCDANEARARKKPRIEVESVTSRPPLPTLSIELFQRRGFAVVSSFLTAKELAYLRDESAQLYAALDEKPAIATRKLLENGCVLDTMASCPMDESALARVQKQAYLQARAQQMTSLGRTSATDSSTLELLVFERLPTLASRALDAPQVFFFNEHYVVKPPHTNVEFRWHRDDDEQLGMCIRRDAIAPYVSAWCALDDITLENGALQFVPLGTESDESVEALKELASEPLVMEAGSVVLFLSNVWHFSACNTSATTRRAYYAQYSRERITATPRDDMPLSFAIPCRINADDESPES